MIYLLWPTVRPATFLKTVDYWKTNAKDWSKVRVSVAVNTEEQKQQLPNFNVMVVGDKRTGVAYASYCLTKNLVATDKDIVILSSDDMFAPKNWDIWVVKQLSNFDGCLMVNDSYQSGGCITIPIMTFSCLKKLNKIVYHPSYGHQFSDAELFHNLHEMKMVKNLRNDKDWIFEHRHWANGKRKYDSVDNRANSSGGADGKNLKTRLRMPLKERLKA